MLKKIWDNFEEYLLIAMYSFVIPLLFMQVVMRYVFSNSLSWSEELARYIFLWQIWIGSSYAVKKSRHIRIDIIKNKISKKTEYILENIVTLICIGFCVFLLFKGGEIVQRIFNLGQLSPAIRLPMGYPYLSVPVGAGLMIIRYIEKLFENFREYKTEVQ